MECVEYELLKVYYEQSVETLHNVLREQEELFQKTQPSAIRYDKDKIQTPPSNSLESYMEQKESRQIDKRIAEAQKMVQDRSILLVQKRQDLMLSKDIHDLVYRYKNLDGIKIINICRMLGYSKSHIYRILDDIEKKLEKIESWEKMRQKMC